MGFGLVRLALMSAVAALALGYGGVALYFWQQEGLARNVSVSESADASELSHPDAALNVVRYRLENSAFTPAVRVLLDQALAQNPSYYEPPLYLAIYHANRFERPAETDRAFRTATRRFPANGRLRLDHARWLLTASARMPIAVADGLGSNREMHLEGERQLQLALTLEPNLIQDGIGVLAARNVPEDRWSDIIPAHLDARNQLVDALAQSGHREEALAILRSVMPRYVSAEEYRRAALLALAWGDPALALGAIDAWGEVARTESPSIEPHEHGLFLARAHLALGEMDEAYDAFRTTLQKVQPSSSAGLKLLCAMGNEYLQLRRVILAESIFREAATYAPTYPEALLGLARTYRYSGQRREAIEHYDALLRVDPDHAYAKRELAPLLSLSTRGPL